LRRKGGRERERKEGGNVRVIDNFFSFGLER